MMNGGFTLALMALLAAMLVWIAIVDIKTYTISNGINLAIAALAPLYWWSAGVPLWPNAGMQVGMAVIVQKYGGSSVADVQKLKTVASRVMRTRDQGHNVVVVHHAFRPDDLVQILEVGAAVPWHACALGHAIVASLDDDRQA